MEVVAHESELAAQFPLNHDEKQAEQPGQPAPLRMVNPDTKDHRQQERLEQHFTEAGQPPRGLEGRVD